ncbi:zinc-dependent peptidase [Marinobacter caseinilyticus]|uniref:M90 family metallopeptidase n=1 Tax=Marinobacter caseinilyticus TaxID=2692195 RepID=UPI00140CA69C|nr:M90 family metallopeptidase [Marinobacter caseinilyticus]
MLGYGLTVLAILGLAVYTLFLHRRWRRRRISRRSFPEHWRQKLDDSMALYGRLPEQERQQLHQHTMLILDEVKFYGCAGLTVTEPMKLLIAAHAALLINRLSMDYYSSLQAILVYPGAYRALVDVRDGPIAGTTEQSRLGESWQQGRVILAWETLSQEAADPTSASNVALHEFAHQLDQVDGAADGAPPLSSGQAAAHWQAVFTDAWQRLRLRHSSDGVIDPYGAQNPAEFFAVVTEAFFLRGQLLRDEEPELYECLTRFYCLTPADWAPRT